MKNAYHRDIMEILLPRGSEGLCLKHIARQVYNRHAGLFNSGFSYRRIYQGIRFYLWHQSRQASSPFMRGDKRGWYAVKPNLGIQMDLHFEEPESLPQSRPEPCRTEPSYPTLF